MSDELEICRVCYSDNIQAVSSCSWAVKCMECFTKVQCYNTRSEAIAIWNNLMKRAGVATR